jgi:hypothetical protein
MKTRILALAVLNVLAACAVASAGGQAQWDERAGGQTRAAWSFGS